MSLVSGTLLVAGAFFILVAGIGVLRLPDVFTRMHAAGIKDTMGSELYAKELETLLIALALIDREIRARGGE